MKSRISIIVVVLLFGLFSCQKKKSSETVSEIRENVGINSNLDILESQSGIADDNLADIDIVTTSDGADIVFIQGWDSIASGTILSSNQYDSLQLDKITHLPYTLNDKFSYRIISNKNQQQLLVLKLDIESEIYQYLLAYNSDGVLVSHLLVSYEDFVEYFSTISSAIKDDIIEVKTIDWGEEKSDTIIETYKIMPNLTFEQVSKNSSEVEE